MNSTYLRKFLIDLQGKRLSEMILMNTKKSLFSCLFSPTCYVVNASSFLGPLHFVQPVYGYVMPVLVLLTSICNLIIILVLSRCFTQDILSQSIALPLYCQGVLKALSDYILRNSDIVYNQYI